mmetsp:Transcript_4009/g.11327  ORF Transcript_4009/g.11327 Transcript_4009/m.11327 type:complete len:109 (+) Transcript_4009:922-1248(+)
MYAVTSSSSSSAAELDSIPFAINAQTYKLTRDLAEHMGKSVSISEDRPGFVVNRILMPMINEAFYALMEGVASPEDIDRGMKLGTNQPMGPLALADLIGEVPKIRRCT